MHVTATEDQARHELTRSITVNLSEGWQGRAQSPEPPPGSTQLHETHLLDLMAPSDFAARLEASGLTAQQLPGYVGFELPVGWTAWLAQPLR